VDRWKTVICLPGRKVYLGVVDTKEKAAAAYDSTARLHFGQNALCNYATQMETEEAILGANGIRVLINDGHMELTSLSDMVKQSSKRRSSSSLRCCRFGA
jgi:hypothetical protein